MSCNRKPRVRRKFFFPLLNLQDLCQELNLICSSLVSIPQATTACPFRGLRVRPRRNATASPQRLRICSVFVALKKSSSRDADLAGLLDSYDSCVAFCRQCMQLWHRNPERRRLRSKTCGKLTQRWGWVFSFLLLHISAWLVTSCYISYQV